mmetsp:Transcript_68393/g.164158  ORF Transcript_68393/g.164158 Transcript_68393/m.164158 type:complete len:237 (-) Transcript_68393:3-713(-)
MISGVRGFRSSSAGPSHATGKVSRGTGAHASTALCTLSSPRASPGDRGITWAWMCGTGWPADAPSSTAMLKAVTDGKCFCSIDLVHATAYQKSSSSEKVRSPSRATGFLGTTTECPTAMGLSPCSETEEPPGKAWSTLFAPTARWPKAMPSPNEVRSGAAAPEFDAVAKPLACMSCEAATALKPSSAVNAAALRRTHCVWPPPAMRPDLRKAGLREPLRPREPTQRRWLIMSLAVA